MQRAESGIILLTREEPLPSAIRPVRSRSRLTAMLLLLALLILASAADLAPAAEIHDRCQEKRLKNVKQLTFGQGMNAEGYFSYDDKYITFQATGAKYGTQCDQLDLSKTRRTTATFAESAPSVSAPPRAPTSMETTRTASTPETSTRFPSQAKTPTLQLTTLAHIRSANRSFYRMILLESFAITPTPGTSTTITISSR
ncbi:hypothetical protein L596_001856 [Steinernema carpocapsae]|uniref:Reelin domain-containing protein n=1 Tax=Steinernema carpocapsae TaxID=34508 RepID=A0A4U8UMQ4_STECR|nr:hypothetical protein L596_001856 [Steinernema carpocapsae]